MQKHDDALSFSRQLFPPQELVEARYALISPSRIIFMLSSMTSTTVEPLLEVSVPPSTKTSTRLAK